MMAGNDGRLPSITRKADLEEEDDHEGKHEHEGEGDWEWELVGITASGLRTAGIKESIARRSLASGMARKGCLEQHEAMVQKGKNESDAQRPVIHIAPRTVTLGLRLVTLERVQSLIDGIQLFPIGSERI